MSHWRQFDPPKVWTTGNNLEVELFCRKGYPILPEEAGSPTIDLKASVFSQGTLMYCVEGSTSQSGADLSRLEGAIRAKVEELSRSGEWTETKIFRVG